MQKHSELVLKLLEKRGIVEEQEIEKFLNPDYERDIFDPYLFHDMEKAVVRTFEAIDIGQKIIIYADYDCDGIPGAVALESLFKKINFKNYEVYIPERNSEGYGLNHEAVDSFIEKNAKLLITIDLGTTAVDEVAHASANGIDVIVTDHHIPPVVLPKAYAILNPKTDSYPEPMLCGSGVIFKFIQAFVKKYGEFYKINSGWEKWALDLVGLATLSDQVPLVGENRALVYFGMKVLKKTPRYGFEELFKSSKLDKKYLTEDDLLFMVTPKINAASRMESPRLAYELLASDDKQEAEKLAKYLSKINDERKASVMHITKHIKSTLEKREVGDVIVVGSPSWRVGVLGGVASKIGEEYGGNIFIWGRDENDIIKGSCRGDGTVSLVELMSEVSEHFIEYGGHEMAGGFSVHADKIHFLEEALLSAYNKIKKEKKEEDRSYDMSADFSILDMHHQNEIEKLAPFGMGNPRPVFLFSDVIVTKARTFGKNGSGEHLELVFNDKKGKSAKAIAFFSGLDSFKTQIREGKIVSLLATFDLSRYAGKVELRLRIVDIM